MQLSWHTRNLARPLAPERQALRAFAKPQQERCQRLHTVNHADDHREARGCWLLDSDICCEVLRNELFLQSRLASAAAQARWSVPEAWGTREAVPCADGEMVVHVESMGGNNPIGYRSSRWLEGRGCGNGYMSEVDCVDLVEQDMDLSKCDSLKS